MSSPNLDSLPFELIQEIALDIPSTAEVLSFGLVNRKMRHALLTSTVYKRRISHAGWDITSWQHEEPALLSPEAKTEQWMHIDNMHGKLCRLFAHVQPSWFARFDMSTHPPAPLSARINWSESPDVLKWVVELSEVLPDVVACNPSYNIPTLTQDINIVPWQMILLTLDQLTLNHKAACSTPQPRDLAVSYIPALERLSISFLLLVQHASPKFLHAMASDFLRFDQPLRSALFQRCDIVRVHFHFPNFLPAGDVFPGVPFKQNHLHDTHKAVGFTVMAIMYLLLKGIQHPIQSSISRAPSLPALSKADGIYESPMYPFLGQGSSLLSALPTFGIPWVGYCTSEYGNHLAWFNSPIRFTLRRPVPADNADEALHRWQIGLSEQRITFVGMGEDNSSFGACQITGNVGLVSGRVRILKQYGEFRDIISEWNGMLTPCGMVGSWGYTERRGWWWIWPRAWSDGKLNEAISSDVAQEHP